MKRPLGYGAILVAIGCVLAATYVPVFELEGTVGTLSLELVVQKLLLGGGTLAAGFGTYLLLKRWLVDRASNRRRSHDLRNVLRLSLGIATTIALLGVLTEQWLGVLLSLGVVGFAITFALQQPLFSLLGWIYIVVKRPYQVGDRVAIEGSKGDVVDVDFLVTTLWEINGELVSSNQPSGRIITLPNSVVLSSHVKNYTREEFPYVWNELTIQVSYETDLDYARTTMAAVADDYIGDQMANRIATYRERLAETPVELEVQDRPTVNVIQEESWVELRLRYLVDPRRGQRVRNVLYERIHAKLNEEPERFSFPVSRNRNLRRSPSQSLRLQRSEQVVCTRMQFRSRKRSPKPSHHRRTTSSTPWTSAPTQRGSPRSAQRSVDGSDSTHEPSMPIESSNSGRGMAPPPTGWHQPCQRTAKSF